MDTSEQTAQQSVENPDLQVLRGILADPALDYDLNRLGLRPGDITDHIEDYYLDRPELIAEVRQAFATVLTLCKQPADLRNTRVIDQTSKVKEALRKIGFE